MCYYRGNPDTQLYCSREQMCEGDDVISWEVDYADKFTLKNWIVHLDLYCLPKAYVGLIGAMFSAGAGIACLIIPPFGDKYGRWVIFQTAMGIQIPLMIMILLTKQLSFVYFFVFVLGWI
jgi:MFS family permease